MNLSAIKPQGEGFTAAQQASFYYARKRRKERERATPAEFKCQGDQLGVTMTVVLTVQ